MPSHNLQMSLKTSVSHRPSKKGEWGKRKAMMPYSTTSRLQTCQSTAVYSGFISHSVLQSFCLGTVRHGCLVACRVASPNGGTHSHDYRRTLFPLTIATPLSTQHLCLIPRNCIHTLQLFFPRSCHGDVEKGMSFPGAPSTPESSLGAH